MVPVSIEGLGNELVTVTPATALRWYTNQERGHRRGAVHSFDITDCAAQTAAAAMLGRRSIWYRRVDAWRFEAGPLSRGKRLAGHTGVVGESPEECVGVHECAAAVTERLAAERRRGSAGVGR